MSADNPILTPGRGVIFMKVGTHAGESLEDIIARKSKEIADAGYALWGYGGGTCHPLSTVQPFARNHEERNEPIYLCMMPMESRHLAEQVRAQECSADGLRWERIPPEINVLGSRYALKVDSLAPADFDFSLATATVAVGTSAGRSADDYIGGHVDKACLDVTDARAAATSRTVHIGLTARVVAPYAVLLR